VTETDHDVSTFVAPSENAENNTGWPTLRGGDFFSLVSMKQF